MCELYAPVKSHRSKSNRLSEYRRQRRSLNRKKRRFQRKLEDANLNLAQIQNIKNKIINTHDQIKETIRNENQKSEEEALNFL